MLTILPASVQERFFCFIYSHKTFFYYFLTLSCSWSWYDGRLGPPALHPQTYLVP